MKFGTPIRGPRGVLALVAGGMTVIAVGPAQADTFSPGNTAPTVGTVTLGRSITPAADGSAVQNVNVTVGDVDSLLDLNTVRLCMYDESHGHGLRHSECAERDDPHLDAFRVAFWCFARGNDDDLDRTQRQL